MLLQSGDVITINSTPKIIISISNYTDFIKLNFIEGYIVVLKDELLSSNISIVRHNSFSNKGYIVENDYLIQNTIFLNFDFNHNIKNLNELVHNQIGKDKRFWFGHFVNNI